MEELSEVGVVLFAVKVVAQGGSKFFAGPACGGFSWREFSFVDIDQGRLRLAEFVKPTHCYFIDFFRDF